LFLDLEWKGETGEARLRLHRSIVQHVIGPKTSKALFGSMLSRKPWCAEITLNNGSIDRRFLKGRFIRECGSVTLRFFPEENAIYQAQEYVSWKTRDRFFFTIQQSKIKRLSEPEVLTWLKNR